MVDEVETLIAKLEDIDRLRPIRRFLEIIVRLGELRDPRAIPSIISAFEWAKRNNCLFIEIDDALVKIGSPAIGSLTQLLRSPDSENQIMAARVLGRIGYPSVVDALIVLLDDDNERLKANAVIALGEIGHPSAVLPLISATQSDSEWVRGRAFDALWKCVDDSSAPILLGLLDDPNNKIREVSVIALSKIKCTDAIPRLIPLSGGNDISIQHAVISFFKELGPIAFPSLAECMADHRYWLRNNSKLLLEKVSEHLGDIIDNAGDIESLAILEKDLKESAASLRKGSRVMDDTSAMHAIAKLMNKAAAKKNGLARMDMEKDGLMLDGERPKPPKSGGGTNMYRAHARAIAR